jgi:hypothetical protein
MRFEVARRGAAIGAFWGVAAAVETLRGTPALRDGAAPIGAALELASIFVCAYGALGAAGGVALEAILAAARSLGLGALERVGAARVLWPLAVLAIGFAAWNEGVRRVDALDDWRHAGRAAIALVAAAVVARGFLLEPPLRRGAFAIESLLALLLAPAAVGVALYFQRPLPAAASEATTTRGILALAPRFAPEPSTAFGGTRAPGRPRVLLVGLDGASWDRIERGIAAGRLPTFARLRAEGRSAPLASIVPTYSPPIWTSILTGARPAAHGIEDFYLLQLPRLGVENLRLRRSFGIVRAALETSGELRFVPVTSSLRRRKALWNLADEAGLSSAVVGLWATWPPEPLQNGVVVSDHASVARQREWRDRGKASQPDAGVTTWPPELADRLAAFQRSPESVDREELSEFVAVDDETWQAFETTREFSKRVRLSAFRSSHLNDAFYARAAESLWREERPDLLVLYLRAIDELSHFFYEAGVPEAASLGWSDADVRRFGGVVDAAYAWTDRALAPLVDEALAGGDTLVAVVSDHGWEREPSGRYNHNDAPPGILILAGAGVCARDCPPLDGASIYDVAPTLLARLGLPLADELEGRPLDAAFSTPSDVTRVAAYGRPIAEGRAVASGDDAPLREKLEALGYTDK